MVNWKKGTHIKNDIGYDKYNTSKLVKPKEANFGLEHIDKKGYILIDARDKSVRKGTEKLSAR